MRKILAFIVSGLVAGAFFYILKLIFSNLLAVLIVTFDSSPSPAITGYGNDAAILIAAIMALYAWVAVYRHMDTPTLI